MFEPEVREILSELLVKSEAGEVKWLMSASAGLEAAQGDDYVVLMPNSSINVFVLNGIPHVNFIDSAGDALLSLEPDSDEEANLIMQIIASARKTIEAPRVRKMHRTLADIKKALRQEGMVGETTQRKFNEEAPF